MGHADDRGDAAAGADDDDYEENPLPDYVELGFIGKRGPADKPSPLQSRMGGRPVWLIPDRLPAAADVTCGVCGQSMPLLLQLYAPDDRFERTYHRVVMIFCCRTGKCHKRPSKCMSVLRCQLPKTSRFLDDTQPLPAAREAAAPLCVICGLAGPSRCARCQRATYCSRGHQVLHWNLAHKPHCSQSPPSADALAAEQLLTERAAGSVLFSPAEIVTEEEWIDDEKLIKEATEAYRIATGAATEAEVDDFNADREDDDDDVDEEDGDAGAGTKSDGGATAKPEDDAEVLFTSGAAAIAERAQDDEHAKAYRRRAVDSEFLRFQRRISFYPKQVLRYARLEGESPPPLWVAPTEQPELGAIPACECCGGPRTFELQLMPQLLLYMDVDDTDVDSLDFGTLIVYSCAQSCDGPSPYMREVVWRQNMSSHGMALDVDAARAAATASAASDVAQL